MDNLVTGIIPQINNARQGCPYALTICENDFECKSCPVKSKLSSPYCPECSTDRRILLMMLQGKRIRRIMAIELISTCPACQEYFTKAVANA